jgi:hypothetical protein
MNCTLVLVTSGFEPLLGDVNVMVIDVPLARCYAPAPASLRATLYAKANRRALPARDRPRQEQ